MVSVYTLGEGVNIPEADTVMFVQPRGSHVDVMQCIGRVQRMSPSTGKTLSYVVLPCTDEEKELNRFLHLIQKRDNRFTISGSWQNRISVIAPDEKEMKEAELQTLSVYNSLGTL